MDTRLEVGHKLDAGPPPKNITLVTRGQTVTKNETFLGSLQVWMVCAAEQSELDMLAKIFGTI